MRRSKGHLQGLGQIRTFVLLSCPVHDYALFYYKLMYAMHSIMFLHTFCMVVQAKNLYSQLRTSSDNTEALLQRR